MIRLLYDQNLSFRLCRKLEDLFPQSIQAWSHGLSAAADIEVWAFAKAEGFTIITQDADFAELASFYGAPPKVIWLRCGNQTSLTMEHIIRKHSSDIMKFFQDPELSCLEILA